MPKLNNTAKKSNLCHLQSVFNHLPFTEQKLNLFFAPLCPILLEAMAGKCIFPVQYFGILTKLLTPRGKIQILTYGTKTCFKSYIELNHQKKLA